MMHSTSSTDFCAPRSIKWRTQFGLSVEEPYVEQRLLQYQENVQNNPFPEIGNGSEDSASSNNNNDAVGESGDPVAAENGSSTAAESAGAGASPDLDPLTAMMMEEQQRTTRLQEMDLKYRKERARRKRGTGSSSFSNVAEDEAYDEKAATLEIIDKDLHRLHVDHGKEGLRELLFVYHCQHPEPGYRQGMHEVASYLLKVLEEPSEVYAVLEIVLQEIVVAYDVKTTHQPLEQMSRRIMSMVARVDVGLWERLEAVQVPPAIYLTKWIRLLFGREVARVLELWDVVFELRGQGYTLLGILEATAAARLLHHRREILLGEDSLHFLMNIPVEQDIVPIVELLRQLLTGHAFSLPRIVAPPSATTTTRTSPRHDRTSLTSSPPTTTTTAAPVITAAFSSMRQQFTEALDKTQSITKKLYHEWENLSTDRTLDDPLRSYDDDIWHAAVGVPSTTTMPVLRSATDTSSSASTIVDHESAALSIRTLPAPTITTAALTPAQRISQEMELHLAVLQNFCMNTQRQHHSVPSSVWESLAELETLRLDLQQL